MSGLLPYTTAFPAANLVISPAIAQDSSSDPLVRSLNKRTDDLISGLKDNYGGGGAANQRKAAEEARKALDKLEKDSADLSGEAQENVLTYLLNQLQNLLSKEDMCALFKKYRGKGGKFQNSKSDYWWQADQFIKKYCPDKAAPPKGGGVKCREGLPTIFDCVEKHDCKLQLFGDGTSTSHCTLQITNPKSGSVATANLHTVCISNKTKKPPASETTATKQGIAYSLGAVRPEARNLVEASKSLNSKGAYESVPLPPDRKAATIAQLSVWKELGDKSNNPADKVTPQSIETDLLNKAKVKRKSLPAAEREEIDKRVNEIFSAVDLTCKKAGEVSQSIEPDEPEQPNEQPKADSPCTSTHPEEPKNNQTPPSDRPSFGPSETSFGGEVIDQHTAEEKICIPPYTVFECNDESYQDMMTVSESVSNCPPAVLTANAGAAGVLPSQGSSPNQTLPNTAPIQTNPHNCCIQTVEVLNDTKHSIVYQLTNENDTPRKILHESSFVASGATRLLGEIRQKQVDVVAYVPGVIGGTVFHYECQAVGQFTVQTGLPGLKTLKITTIDCATPVIVSAPKPATNTADQAGQGSVDSAQSPQPSPDTGGTNSPSTSPNTSSTNSPGKPQGPSTSPGATGAGRTTPAGTGTGSPAGSGGNSGSPAPGSQMPMQNPNGKKNDKDQQAKRCIIKAIKLKNDYKKSVVYTAYSLTSNGLQGAVLASSITIKTGETTALQGNFGERIRVSATDAQGKNSRPIAIQEYACEGPGEQSIASDYDAFHQVTVVSGR